MTKRLLEISRPSRFRYNVDGKEGKDGVTSKKSTLKKYGHHTTTNDKDGDKRSIGGDKSAKKIAADNEVGQGSDHGKKVTELKPWNRKATNDEDGGKEDTGYKSAELTVTRRIFLH